MSFHVGDDMADRPSTSSAAGDIGNEEARSPTPGPGSDSPTVRRRKSGTFWKRRSSMSLATAFAANGGTDTLHGTMNGHKEDVTVDGQENEQPLAISPISDLRLKRSWSPPPQIPAFIGGGGSLGGEDLFKDIQ